MTVPIRGVETVAGDPRSPRESVVWVSGPRRDPRSLVYVACHICSRAVRLSDAFEAEDGLALCQTCGPWELSAL